MRSLVETARDFPFGVKTSLLVNSFVVLDKSFLDAVSSTQLQYYVQHGTTFGVTDVLMYELMRKSDDQRRRSLFKLYDAQGGLLLLPGIGEMFRAESKSLRPSAWFLKARRVEFTPDLESSVPFRLTPSELHDLEGRTVDLQNKRVPQIIKVWRDLGLMPELRDAGRKELPEKLEGLEQEIRDNDESMRGFYGNHRQDPYPASNLIDKQWTFFRWIQVYLLAGLDFFRRYDVRAEPNREKLLHELLDLDYTITALLVGGLASCEKRIEHRFRFLRPDGFFLRYPARASP